MQEQNSNSKQNDSISISSENDQFKSQKEDFFESDNSKKILEDFLILLAFLNKDKNRKIQKNKNKETTKKEIFKQVEPINNKE